MLGALRSCKRNINYSMMHLFVQTLWRAIWDRLIGSCICTAREMCLKAATLWILDPLAWEMHQLIANCKLKLMKCSQMKFETIVSYVYQLKIATTKQTPRLASKRNSKDVIDQTVPIRRKVSSTKNCVKWPAGLI